MPRHGLNALDFRQRRRSGFPWHLAGCVVVALATWSSRGEDIVPASDRPDPKSPAESLQCIRMPPGFRMDLVASEPLIRDPTAVAFDERGRLFVCEIHGYNLDGYLDIVELNRTGRLDREVRRVRQATAESRVAAAGETFGTVRLLRDTDGDGRMDCADVWADRLPPCYGLTPARGGMIVICAPDIVFLADRDGDGQAEVRETIFTGFARELIERGINNPRPGPDNWIYVAAGGGGGEITGPGLRSPVMIGQTDFRFRPDGSAIEPVTGRERMFGLTMTDFGDRFHTIISHTSPLPYRCLLRNPFVESPPGDISVLASRQLFPISQPDPWRRARAEDPAWVQFYGVAETQPNGQFTASSGPLIYRADAFPPPYRGNYFVCDPANNLIHRSLLERSGADYVARRAPENAASEFLASTDQWFRPINLSIGPDGAVYIVDMYREIIEDFSAIPRFLQQQYAEALVAGQDHGRVWRLSWQGKSFGPGESSGSGESSGPGDEDVQRDRPPLPVAAAPDRLAELLDHPNHWWRDTAQRLLTEHGGMPPEPEQAGLLRSRTTPPGRLQALYVLDSLQQLTPGDVLRALEDETAELRVHALQLAERWLDDQPMILDRVAALATDSDPRVRIQTALTLGESRDPRAVAALAALAADHGAEPWMAAAVASSIGSVADEFVALLLAAGQLTPGARATLGPAGETVGARRDVAAVGRFLHDAAGLTGPQAAELQLVLLQGLATGLDRGSARPVVSETIVRGLERLLASPCPDVSEIAVRIAGLIQLHDIPAMQAVWETASRTAVDEGQPLAARLAAVSLLATAPWEQTALLQPLLSTRHPGELQIAAVTAISRSARDEVCDVLLSGWDGLVPQVQEATVDAFVARQERVPKFLDAVERGVIAPAAISPLRREQLTEHRDSAIRLRARQLLGSRTSEERVAVIRAYAAALALPRNPGRGEAVFQKTCAHCHRLGQRGLEVGPDLLAVRTRPDETLLVDILDPSSSLSRGYSVYTVATTDGRVHTGLLAGENPTSVTLRNAAAASSGQTQPSVVDVAILRRDIDEMKSLSKSLMPDGLEQQLSLQDLADLIGFLRGSPGPVTD